MSGYRIVGELDNDHRYATVSQKVIRMIHAEIAS